MEPKIKSMNLFVRILTFGWAGAICLAPFGIYVRQKYLDWINEGFIGYKVLFNHEKTHWKQQMELLIIPFYLLYFLNWVILLIVHTVRMFFTQKRITAYSSICFEREANDHEKDPFYWRDRKRFAWVKYITLK